MTRLLCVPLLLCVTACTLALTPKDEQCDTTADCTRRGGPFANTVCLETLCVPRPVDPAWSCLGKVKPVQAPPGNVMVTIPLRELLNPLMPVRNAFGRACAKIDAACENPLGPTVQPTDDGILTLAVPAGFDGYIEIMPPPPAAAPRDGGTRPPDAGPAPLPAFVPALVFINPPVVKDRLHSLIPLISPQGFVTLASQVGGAQIDSTLGGFLFEAHDCQDKPAGGVTAAVDQSSETTRRFFYVNGLPSESVTATDGITGYGGFINVPPGVRTVTGTRKEGNARVGTVSVLVRRGTLSYTVLPPLP